MGRQYSSSVNCVSVFTFALFIYFNVDFFLHLSQRIPGYGIVRPTLVLVLWLSLLLFLQRDKFRDVYTLEPFKKIKALIVYLALTFLIVRWPGSVIGNLPLFVKAVCFFFFTALIIDSEKRLKIFLSVFVVCQLIRVYEPLFLNLTQGYWGGKTHLGSGEFAQRLAGAPSDIINPNELGFVIATIIPFIYYLLWNSAFKSKALFLILLPPLLYALILTMSRGALLALLVVGWMVFKSSKYKVFLVLAALGVAVAGWSVMDDYQKDRYLSLVSSDASSSATVDGRLSGMVNELVLGLTTRPIFGNGLGTTQEAKYHKWGKSKASHNLYAELLIEIGVIGMFLFISYLASLWRMLKVLLGTLKAIDDVGFWSNLSMAMLAIFWMYAVYSINYYGLSIYYWYMFGGLVIAVNRVVVEGKKHSGS